MDFGDTCLLDDLPGVVFIDTTAGHDDQTAGRLFLKSAQKGDAFKGGGLLAGGEQTVTTEFDDLF